MLVFVVISILDQNPENNIDKIVPRFMIPVILMYDEWC